MPEVKNFDPEYTLTGRLGDLREDEAIKFAMAALEELEQAVGYDGCHGALRPGNVSLFPDGTVALGPTSIPRAGELGPDELEYIAPEAFWSGTVSAAADVYSMGLMLYAARNGGRLPFWPEGEVTPDDRARAVQKRIGGEDIPPPAYAGQELCDAIMRAVSYRAEERWPGAAEFQRALGDCPLGTAKPLPEESVAEKVFAKPESELNEVEMMMAGIIASSALKSTADEDEVQPEPLESEPELETNPEPETETEELGDTKPLPVVTLSHTPETPEADKPDKPGTEVSEDTADAKDGESEAGFYDPWDVPPVEPPAVKKPPRTPPVLEIYQEVFQEKAEKQKKRRGFWIQIAVAAVAVIAIAALLYLFLRDGGDAEPEPTPTPTVTQNAVVVSPTPLPIPTATPEPEETPEPTPSETPEPTPEPTPTYELFIENVSWQTAKERCEEKGGHLASVTSEEQLSEILSMLDGTAVKYVWLGAYRDDEGNWLWVDGTVTDYYPWDAGEPSYKDSDGTVEKYLLLWNVSWGNKGWWYNSMRNNPYSAYPKIYGGKIAYVCQYDPT